MSHIARRCALGALVCIIIFFGKAAQADVFFSANSLEKECLVWIIYYEGAEANEPFDGLAAIAQTVVNRQEAAAQDEALRKKFGGNSFCALMTARRQFSFMLTGFGLRNVCQQVVTSKVTGAVKRGKQKQVVVRTIVRAIPHGEPLSWALAAANEVLEGVWQPVEAFLHASKERITYYMNPKYSGRHVCVFRSEFSFVGKFPGSAHELYALPKPEELDLLKKARGCKHIRALL